MSDVLNLNAAAVPPARVRHLGPWQAIGLFVGFELVQTSTTFGGAFLCAFVIGFRNALHHVTAPFSPGPQFVSALQIGGYILAGLWSYRFVLRRAASRFSDGSSSGIGLRAAPWRSYAAAVALAGAVLVVVAMLFKWLPIAPKQAANTVWARALSGSGNSHLLTLILILVSLLILSPILEEFVFRGAIFAGVAGRWGRTWASVITTLLFVVAHFSEKRHYLPGFLDVTLLAIATLWLRLHYKSLRPAMVCHATYNIGVIYVSWLLFA